MKDNQAKYPQLRFKGFTDPWEQRKLTDISEKVTEKNSDNEFSETLTNSAEYGIISQRDFFDKDISNKKNLNTYYVVRDGDFVYNPRISNFAPVGPIKRNTLGRTGVMSPLYYIFRAHNVDGMYLEKYFSSTKWHRFMELNGDTGARADRFAIKDKDFVQMPIPLPNLEEQSKIARFLENVDNLIAANQRKLDLLKEQKKGYLQKMFPKNGAKVPELRFAGFADDWEERKFLNLAEVRRGLTYKPSDVQKYGVRVLRSSNIAEDTFLIKSDDVFVNKEAVKIDNVKNGDILITSANGSSRLVGKHALIEGIENDTVHGGFMLVARAEKPEFVNAIMSSSWYSKFINIFVSGGNGAIGNLSKSDLEDQKVYVPSEIEQTKIGLFFKGLDDTIALHQRKLDLLKEQKKGFLQKMFV